MTIVIIRASEWVAGLAKWGLPEQHAKKQQGTKLAEQ